MIRYLTKQFCQVGVSKGTFLMKCRFYRLCTFNVSSCFLWYLCDPLEVSELIVPALCSTGDNNCLIATHTCLLPHFAWGRSWWSKHWLCKPVKLQLYKTKHVKVKTKSELRRCITCFLLQVYHNIRNSVVFVKCVIFLLHSETWWPPTTSRNQMSS